MTKTKKRIVQLLDTKGLGFRVAIGSVKENRKYARLVGDGHKYNIQIVENPHFREYSLGDAPNFAEVYLFPEMVSWDEANKRYSELREL